MRSVQTTKFGLSHLIALILQLHVFNYFMHECHVFAIANAKADISIPLTWEVIGIGLPYWDITIFKIYMSDSYTYPSHRPNLT